MADNQCSRRLQLNTEARIITGPQGLRVLQRRGLYVLRGKDLTRLHERIAPLLDGRFTRAQIITSVGRQAPAVGAYLDALYESGALGEQTRPSVLEPEFPEPRPGIQMFRWSGTRAAVTLAGAEVADSRILQISFVTTAELERRVLGLERHPRASAIWIVSDSRPDGRELSRRAAIARHLLAIELGRGAPRQLSILQLAPERFALHQLVLINSPQPPLPQLVMQLQLIRPQNRTQIPLVSAVGHLTGSGAGCVAYGLDAEEVQRSLLTRFLARAALFHCANGAKVPGFCGFRGARSVRCITLTHGVAARAVVGWSSSDCAEQLIAAWALRDNVRPQRQIDLLAFDPPSRRVALLQDSLRRRRRSAPATLDDRLAPLMIFRLDGAAVARLGFEEALAETLLRAVAAGTSIDTRMSLPCAPSLCHPATIRRRLARVTGRIGKRLPTITGRFRRFGKTFYFGIEDEWAASE